MWEDKADLLVRRIRQIGTNRLIYGSDAATAGNSPKDALKRWHSLPLTQEEFRDIDNNIAPYLFVIGSRPRSPSVKLSSLAKSSRQSRSANRYALQAVLSPTRETVHPGVSPNTK